MAFTLSEMSKGKKSLLYDGFTFRIDNVLKYGDISWRCTVKNGKGRIKTDEHSSAIINGNCNHAHESDSRKNTEAAYPCSCKAESSIRYYNTPH